MRTGVAALPPSAANEAAGRPASRGAIVVGATVASAAIERPVLGGVGLVAAFVAAHRRQGPTVPHVNGAAAGAVAALATLFVLPRRLEQPARGIAVAERHHVEPSPEGEGLVVVVNPGGGSGTASELLDRLRDGLPHAEIRVCEEGDDLVDLLADAAASCRSLGIVGGDGSVNAAAKAALGANVPLVVFPGGTLNHFARDLGLDSVDDVIDAVREGQVVAIDVGMIDDRAFVNNASIGSYSELVDERERLEQRLGKWPAMLVALIRVLRRGTRFEVLLDGEPRTVWMVFFGNSAYEPAGFAPAERPDLVDGLIDVRLVDASAPFSRARLIGALLFGALARSRVYECRMVPSLSVCVEGEEPVRLAADGETFDGPAAFLVRKRPASLLVHMAESETTVR